MPAKTAILLDSNAGAPLHPVVVEALFAFLNQASLQGNPSSSHSFGRESSANVETARHAILKTLCASPAEWTVTFTSSGTEANQLAIRGVLMNALEKSKEGKRAQPVWAVSPVEHSCIIEMIEPMKRAGVEVRILPVKPNGEVKWESAQIADATLISAIGVSNETGQVQTSFFSGNITSHILCGKPSLSASLIHTDYVAGWGKVELDLSKPGSPDLVAIAGHKLGALSGVGALIHRKGIKLQPVLPGKQQGGVRGGTENLTGILSLKTISTHWEAVRKGITDLATLRDRFESELQKRLPGVRLTSTGTDRSPHLSHFSFPGLAKSLSLVQNLDLQGYAVSSGSACSSQVIQPSHVLIAQGFTPTDALNALRVSLHPGNTWEDMSGLIDALEVILKRNEVLKRA